MKAPRTPHTAAPSTQAWWSRPGIVYFIAAGKPPAAIKIGTAAETPKLTFRETIVRRLSQIQTSNHEPIELLGVIRFEEGPYPTRDAEARERELHAEFERLQRFLRHRRGAEWFTASPELLARIAAISVSPEVLGVPRSYSEPAPPS